MKILVAMAALLVLAFALRGWQRPPVDDADPPAVSAVVAGEQEPTADRANRGVTQEAPVSDSKTQAETQTVILAGGCFWCVEAVFEELQGVTDVVSGYIGGSVERPTYERVCSGETGHAEACRITFDPTKISYDKLLEIFFRTHDPTTLNRQGNDFGTQYRSAVFVQSDDERARVERIISALNESGAFRAPVVTTVEAATEFYPAEDYHQDYFRKNPFNGYCRAVIPPKLEKLKKAFAEQVKGDSPAPEPRR